MLHYLAPACFPTHILPLLPLNSVIQPHCDLHFYNKWALLPFTSRIAILSTPAYFKNLHFPFRLQAVACILKKPLVLLVWDRGPLRWLPQTLCTSPCAPLIMPYHNCVCLSGPPMNSFRTDFYLYNLCYILNTTQCGDLCRSPICIFLNQWKNKWEAAIIKQGLPGKLRIINTFWEKGSFIAYFWSFRAGEIICILQKFTEKSRGI